MSGWFFLAMNSAFLWWNISSGSPGLAAFSVFGIVVSLALIVRES